MPKRLLPRDELLTMPASVRESLRMDLRPSLWTEHRAKLRLPKGGAIGFDDHPFLRTVYDDLHNDLVVMKGAQMGFSTWAIARTFWISTTFPCSVIYTFPTGAEVTEFTAARINPLVNSSEWLSQRIVDVNSVKMKQFMVLTAEQMQERMRVPRPHRARDVFRSTVYFSGSASEKDSVAVDADLLVHDEVDLSNPQIIEQFEGRLDHSEFKWKIRLSTPRLPGAGVDRLFRQTDMRKWLVRCSHCGSQFEMAFPGGPWDYSNIEPDTGGWTPVEWDAWVERGSPARYVCHKCHRPLSDEDRATGQWVPEKTAPYLAHGYAVSQLAAPWRSASQVLDRKRKATWESDFWNLVMGIPWEDGANALTRDGLLARCGIDPMATSGQGCTMGVDVGAKMDVVIGRVINGVPHTVYIGRKDTFGELDILMQQFGVVECVIDAAPEEHMTREWADKYNQYRQPNVTGVTPRIRVWRCVYGGTTRPGSGPQLQWNETTGVVTAPRTEILSMSVDELLTERVLPRRADMETSEGGQAYLKHHVNTKKVAVYVEGLEVEKMIDRYSWIEVGPDHQFHAAAYELIARLAPRGIYAPRTGMVTLTRGKMDKPAERRINPRIG